MQTAAAAITGLTVPVQVTIGIDTHPLTQLTEDAWSLERRLINQAAEAIPTSAALPGTPLQRLQEH